MNADLIEAVLKLLLSGALGIIAFFLKATAGELREVRKLAEEHEVTLARHDERIKDLEEP